MNKRIKFQAIKVVEAWDSIPDGYLTTAQVQRLLENLRPEIDKMKILLKWKS